MIAHADAPSTDFRFPSGLSLVVEESHAIPLVEFQVTLRTGSAHDPDAMLGLARATARMLRMGTRAISPDEVDERIDALGGSLGIEVAPSYTRLSASVIRRNLEPMIDLVYELLRRPAFRVRDLEQVKRETIADIIDNRDNDRGLAAQAFREAVFGASHPYGRRVIGTQASVASITVDALRTHWSRHYVRSNLIVGFTGDITPEEARAIAARTFDRLPEGRAPAEPRIVDPVVRGRRVVIVDKPERTQTQIYIGGVGTHFGDPDHTALLVANTIFGGTFTSRLMREVRSERGWSYGASSRFGIDRARDSFAMWTFPSMTDAVACIELELQLLERLVRGGITRDELVFAQSYLSNSWAFEIDTPGKRLEQRVEVELFGLPRDYFSAHIERLRAVSRSEANAALRARLSAEDVVIVLVATASEVQEALARLPGVSRVDVIPFDRD